MTDLDEDALVELHDRVRRARTKYVKLYRREASARVVEQGARGVARPKNRRNAEKAEVFEDALARVSRRLAAVARESAAELKAERLAAARKDPAGPDRSTPRRTSAGPNAAQVAGSVRKSPAKKKRDASTLATGARRQAKRDPR